jgi:hypothetical protein
VGPVEDADLDFCDDIDNFLGYVGPGEAAAKFEGDA